MADLAQNDSKKPLMRNIDKVGNKCNNLGWISVVAAGIVVLFVIIANHLCPFMFENDNIYFKTILSGEMTGEPSPYAYYIGYISGIIISTLYKLTGNGIPWYGIVLCLYMCLVIWYVLFSVFKETKKLYATIIVALCSVLMIVAYFFRFFAELHYTIVGGILGAGAVFALSMVDNTKKPSFNKLSLTMLFVFSFLSYSVREKTFFMMIPFLVMVVFKWILDFCFLKKGKVKLSTTGLAIGIMLCACLFNYVANTIAYSSDEWETYERYNVARTDMVDYYSFPDYEENKDVYDSLGITESSYRALDENYNLILDININADSFEALNEISKQDVVNKKEKPLDKAKTVVTNIISRNLFEYTDRPINILVFFLYFSVVTLIIITKKWQAIFDFIALAIARMFDWIYLVSYGRYPFRVTQIIYIAELLSLIAIIIRHCLWKKKENADRKKESAFKIYSCALAVLALIISVRFALPVAADVGKTVKAFDGLSVSFVELEQYLEKHQDNFYFFDMSNLHYRERALSFKPAEYENYVYMGSWLANIPLYNEKLKKHGITDPAKALAERDDLFIIYQEYDGGSWEFLNNYFKEHFPGTSLEIADKLTTTNGFVYLFLQVMK